MKRQVADSASIDTAYVNQRLGRIAANRRYRWLGDRTRGQVWRLMARSRAMVLSSEMEGGANVISEAAVAGLPVIASAIPGSLGLLGDDYPGYYPVADEQALAEILQTAVSHCRWQWPERTIYFFADPHADAEAFAASLVASGGVRKTGPRARDIRLTAAGRQWCPSSDPTSRTESSCRAPAWPWRRR